MQRSMFLALICVLQIAGFSISNVCADGQYTVIGPGTLHPAHKYNVVVGVHHTSEPVQLKVGLTGPKYEDIKTIDLQPNELQQIEFDVPCLEKDKYNLTAEGVSGIVFKNTTHLNFGDFKPYVRIQTDKGIYKPGDTINFRVLFLDENLKPTTPLKNTVLWIEDGKSNRIKEYKNLEVVKGVHTGQFEISNFPVLGNWRLYVASDMRTLTQVHIEVAKYVLPKYNVKIQATENIAVQDGDMQVIVRSNYTYGKPVNGKVTVIVELGYYDSDKHKTGPPQIIKTTNMVNGKAKFDLNVKDYEPYLPYKTSSSYLPITATVEENFTGVKINATTGSSLYPYRYDMRCISYETCGTFHADKESEVLVQILHVDQSIVKDTKSVVKLIYTEEISKAYFWRRQEETTTEAVPPKIDSKKIEFEGHMNETGFASFNVKLPELEAFEYFTHFYRLEVEYAGEKRVVYTTYQYRKPKDSDLPTTQEEPKDYFYLNPQYEEDKYNYDIGDDAILTVNSSEPLSYIHFNLIGRGNILQSERIELPENPKVYNITLKTNFLMAPYSRVYVFYVDQQGNLHYAETNIQVNVKFQNKIEISAPEKVKPGENVSLRIKTEPNSFVGLLAVDQSVLMLRDNHDIGQDDFSWRLSSFSTYTPWQGGYSTYPGDSSGVVTLTNANYFYNRTVPENHPNNNIGGLRETLFSTKTQSAAAPVSDVASGFAGAAGSGGGGSSKIAVRKDFSETWIFANIENTETEEFTWTKTIPDTITTWVLKGFSLNPEKGLGVTNGTTNIITFQPFFVSIRLPYSVKRGEVISVPALVFNYLDKDLDVEVSLENPDDEFEFTEVSNEVLHDQVRKEVVRVPAYESRGVSFLIRPKTIGKIMLKFTAVSPVAGDAVHKTLKVEPEGVTEYANRAYLVNLKDSPEFKDDFELDLPNNVVQDSEHIEFTVIGDLLGPLLYNLDNFVRMPTGCGEQTISSMVPNYYVLRYLNVTNKLTPDREYKIKRNLESGYQHILAYRHKDGSFSSFGPTNDVNKKVFGSTWLTAYVVRALHEAKEHIDPDKNVLAEGLKYLSENQAENGSFVEKGDYFYSYQRNHITLTATAILAFLENAELTEKYQSNIDKGFKFILDNFDKADNPQAKALAIYTLHKANKPEVQEKISGLDAFAKSDGDRKWWSNVEERPHIWWRWVYSNDVEMTSYMLLTLLDTKSIDELLPIVKWLVAQRNSYGGFSSTHDTVVGLQALIKFVEKSGYEPAVMDIDITANEIKQESISVNEDNALLLNLRELPQKTNKVHFEAKGKGAALVQISYQYNVLDKDNKPSFTVNAVVNKDTPPFKLEMEVCVDYTGEGEASNMALLEVSLPSGYEADSESFDDIKKLPQVRQVETKNEETVVVVYFQNLHKNDVQCLPINAIKQFPVAMQKPSTIVLYDYYDTTRKAKTTYEVESKLCDLCDEDKECQEKCK